MAPTGLVVSGLLLLTLLPSPVPAQRDGFNETYFILTNFISVMVLNLQGAVQHEFSNTFSSQVDFDPRNESIFWPDEATHSINRAFLNGSERRALQLPPGSVPWGVAVDHILQLVFYSDYDNNLIGVVDTDGGSHRIVRNQSLTYPYVLAVDVIHEFLYYTESRSLGNIGRMDYNGGSHEILHSNLSTPRGLALDVRGGRMYWSTSGDGRLESARLDGTDRTLVWQGQIDQYGLAFSDGVLYFTVYNDSSIFSVNVTGINGTDPRTLPINVSGNYWDIAVYSKSQAITPEEKQAALALTETPFTATPGMEETPSTATSGMKETPSTTPRIEDSSTPSAMIGGIIGGITALVVIVVIVIVIVRKRRGRREKRQTDDHYSGLHLDTRAAPRDQSMYDQLQGHRNPAGPHRADPDYLHPTAQDQEGTVYHDLDSITPQQAVPEYLDMVPTTQDQANPYYSGLNPATRVNSPEPAPYERLGMRQNMTSARPPSGTSTDRNYANASQPDSAARPDPQNPYYNAARQSEQP